MKDKSLQKTLKTIVKKSEIHRKIKLKEKKINKLIKEKDALRMQLFSFSTI